MSNSETAVPLWAPLYRATLAQAVGRFWKKAFRFDGRAGYREYWWVYLFLAVGYIVSLTLLYTGLGIWSGSNDEGPPPVIFPIGLVLTILWFLATVVPWLSLEARRLHDANKSGFLLLIHLASWPGAIAVFVLTQLGPNPLGRRFDAPPGEAPRFAASGAGRRHRESPTWPSRSDTSTRPGRPALPPPRRLLLPRADRASASSGGGGSRWLARAPRPVISRPGSWSGSRWRS